MIEERGEHAWVDDWKWDAKGLLPAIVQDAATGQVLMMAWMDRAALLDTLRKGQTHFYSRSRRSHWHKGGTSGHVQDVETVHVDCDADTLLIGVHQIGGACHEGFFTCVFRKAENGRLRVVSEPVFDPATVYPSNSNP